MRTALPMILALLVASPTDRAAAQEPLAVATDVTADEIEAFIDALPRDSISDRPIRSAEVTGGYRITVYGVYRPTTFPGNANLHQTATTEIYYMLSGAGTLVTGGAVEDVPPGPNTRGQAIAGGHSRRIVPGDVVIIPGHTPHWWSALESDLEYLIIRPSPGDLVEPQDPPPATVDITAADIDAFIDALPPDRISDRPIRVADVGGWNVGVYGVFRPQELPGNPIRHQTSVAEVYYVLEGSGTLVTGGTITDERSTGDSPNMGTPNFAGSGVDGGTSRSVEPGDVIIIPGNTPHWFSSLDTDIRYLIFRPDPEALQTPR